MRDFLCTEAYQSAFNLPERGTGLLLYPPQIAFKIGISQPHSATPCAAKVECPLLPFMQWKTVHFLPTFLPCTCEIESPCFWLTLVHTAHSHHVIALGLYMERHRDDKCAPVVRIYLPSQLIPNVTESCLMMMIFQQLCLVHTQSQ